MPITPGVSLGLRGGGWFGKDGLCCLDVVMSGGSGSSGDRGLGWAEDLDYSRG